MSTPAPNLRPLSTERKVQAGFALALACLAVIGVVSFQSVRQLRDDQAAVDHTHSVIAALRQVEALINAAESAQRGHTITGDESFLDAYKTAKAKLDAGLARVRQLTADNAAQQRELDALEPLVSKRMAVSRQIAETRRREGFPAAQAMTASGAGRLLHGQLVALLARMEQAERTLLVGREAHAQRSATRTQSVIVAGGGLALAVAGLALSLIRRDFAGSRRAEAALRTAHDELEARVAARTAELRASEARLRIATDNARVGLVVISPERRYLFANTAYADLLGLASADLVGQRVADVLAPVYEEQIRPRLDRAFAGERVSYELRKPVPEGALLYAVSYEPVGTDGSVAHVVVVITDITERKRVEEALLESEARLRLFIQHAPAALAMFDREMRYLAVSRRWLADYGLGTGSVLGRSHYEVFPEVPDGWKAVHRRALAGEAVRAEEDRFARADGMVQWLRWEVRPWHSADGGVGGIIIFTEEITARKRAEAAVQASEQRLRGILDTMFVFVGLMDLEGRMLEVNEAPLAAAGLTRADVLGRTVPESFWFAHSPSVQAQVRQALTRAAQGQVVREDYLIRIAGGECITIDCTFAPLRDASGRVAQIVGSAVDITARVRATAALREAEARLRLSVAASNIGLWDWNLATNEVFFSPEWKAQLGHADHEISNQFSEWESRVHPDDLAPTLAKIKRFLAEPAADYAVEFRLRHKDGSYRWIFTQANLLRDAAGKPVRMLGCHLDITERKRAEAEVLASREQLRALLDRLQRAQEEERTRMAREIHDELGQLLTGLKMDTRWLERKLSEPGAPAMFAPLLDRAVAASELADTTIAAVRKLAAELRPGALDQLGLGAALEEKARRFAEQFGIPCVAVVPEAEPLLSREIRTELFYICREALTNVARHAHASRVEIHLTAGPDAVTLVVADNGVGLAEAGSGGRASLGVLGMRERAAHCGGTVAIGPNEPRGTRVAARIPLPPVPTKGETTP